MTDVSDSATEREEKARAAALAAQVHRAGLTGKTIRDSALQCAMCDEHIPDLRRAAVPGVQTCIECQEELDLAQHLNGKGYQ